MPLPCARAGSLLQGAAGDHCAHGAGSLQRPAARRLRPHDLPLRRRQRPAETQMVRLPRGLLHRVFRRLLRSGITGVKDGALPATPSCILPQCSL